MTPEATTGIPKVSLISARAVRWMACARRMLIMISDSERSHMERANQSLSSLLDALKGVTDDLNSIALPIIILHRCVSVGLRCDRRRECTHVLKSWEQVTKISMPRCKRMSRRKSLYGPVSARPRVVLSVLTIGANESSPGEDLRCLHQGSRATPGSNWLWTRSLAASPTCCLNDA